MRGRFSALSALAAAFALGAGPVLAVPVSMSGYGINVDGVFWDSFFDGGINGAAGLGVAPEVTLSAAPGLVALDMSAWDDDNVFEGPPQGFFGEDDSDIFDGGDVDTISATIQVAGAGDHNIHLFVDLDIDAVGSAGTADEDGATVNESSKAPGQTWEIDEPGFGGGYTGDIVDNVGSSRPDDDGGSDLDETVLTNSDPDSSSPPEDIAMALGINFSLAAGETATYTYVVSLLEPDPQLFPEELLPPLIDGDRFFLEQVDPGSDDEFGTRDDIKVRFWGTLNVTSGNVPEPGALGLLGLSLVGLAAVRRRRSAKRDALEG